MMFIAYVDDDRNNNARHSLRLALSSHSHQTVVGEQKLDSLSLIGRMCSAAAAGSAFFPLGQSEAMVLSSHLRSLFGDRGARTGQ